MKSTRRNFLKNSLLVSAIGSLPKVMTAEVTNEKNPSEQAIKNRLATDDAAFSISLFSKHLHWMNYSQLAETAVEAGFDGIDLTVRPGGHVLPERVETDLPRAVAAARNAGTKINFITTGINDASDPLTLRVLKTASYLGIPRYRMGYFYYNSAQSIEENIQLITGKMTALEKLNRSFQIHGEYQNHSKLYDPGVDHGDYFGSTIWDLYQALRNIDSPWIHSQYDIGHGMIEATRSWPIGFELLSPYISSLHVKDYVWQKIDQIWEPVMVPLGTGMVDFSQLFKLLRQKERKLPITFYYGYDVGDEKRGANIRALQEGVKRLRKFL